MLAECWMFSCGRKKNCRMLYLKFITRKVKKGEIKKLFTQILVFEIYIEEQVYFNPPKGWPHWKLVGNKYRKIMLSFGHAGQIMKFNGFFGYLLLFGVRDYV